MIRYKNRIREYKILNVIYKKKKVKIKNYIGNYQQLKKLIVAINQH